MKKNILDNRPTVFNPEYYRPIQLPQMVFIYKIGEGMVTEYIIKKVGFNIKDVKGELNWDNYTAYPYGYTGLL